MSERDDLLFDELFTQGSRLLHRGKAKEAVVFLEKAFELRPDHLDGAINLGGAYILTKQFKSAVKVLERAIEIDARSAMAWTNLGAAYLGNPVLARDEEQVKAIAAFQKVLEIEPEAPNVAYNIGLIYQDRKEWSQAAEWFAEALAVNPSDRDARSLLEKMKKQQNRE